MEDSTQVPCPFCRSSLGYARGVSVTGDLKTLTFTCVDCQRTWQGPALQMLSTNDLFQGLRKREAQEKNG